MNVLIIFLNVLTQREIHRALSRIWTRDAVSIFEDDHYYIMSTLSIYIHIYVLYIYMF